MSPKERRQFPRVATHNLYLNITFEGGDAQSISQIRCRIVNINLTGLQIETQYPIESKDVHLKAVDFGNNPIEINGRVVYCEEISPEIFHVGIGFVGSNMNKYKFMSRLTEPFSNYLINIAIGGERLSV